MNFLKDIASVALTPFGGENLLSRVPVVGGLLGAESDAQKALLKKQEELAAEAKKRQEINQRMRMQALGQSLLAFNPQNQMMAQMFGPQAAFSPQQFAQMGNDPGAQPLADAEKAWQNAAAQGGGPGGRIPEDVQAALERARENERRKRAISQQMTPLGPGPAPLQLPTPQAGRRY